MAGSLEGRDEMTGDEPAAAAGDEDAHSRRFSRLEARRVPKAAEVVRGVFGMLKKSLR
jgi:hypothetical protein